MEAQPAHALPRNVDGNASGRERVRHHRPCGLQQLLVRDLKSQPSEANLREHALTIARRHSLRASTCMQVVKAVHAHTVYNSSVLSEMAARASA